MSRTSFRHEFLDLMEKLVEGQGDGGVWRLRNLSEYDEPDLWALALLALMEQIEGKPLLIRSTEPPTSEPT